MYDLALALCKYAHDGQKDKGGNDYYLHPLAVSNAVTTEKEKVVALLHDVLEDTFVTQDTIKNLFGDEILEAVLSVTKREGEDYIDFVRRAKRNPIGRAVKIADIRNNMDLSRLSVVTNKDMMRMGKYQAALEILNRKPPAIPYL